jgi:ribosomal protein L37AE/L43A
MDVQEGLLFVTKAKSALVERDVVRAAKLTRHLKNQSGGMTAQLDKERIQRGVAEKIEDAKCGKCGKEALYSFPGDVRKCVKCGHSFSMTVEPMPATMEPIEGPVSSSTEKKDNPSRPEGAPRKRILAR